MARTPYVAFSDDDSWWEPGALARAAEVFDAHPRLGLIAARTVVGPEREPDPINAAMARSPLPPEDGLPGPPVLGFLACGAVVRRAAFLEVGGFSTLLFFVGEERLLAYDLAAADPGEDRVTADPDEGHANLCEEPVTADPRDDPAAGAARVTVVVMTRNRRDELLRTLDLMTRLPEQPPLIVVDNGSSDGTPGAVERAHPEVRLIRARRNLGAVARNVAVERVTTPYVAFCDEDTWWEPGALGRAADLLDRHGRLASVTGRILVEPGQEEDPITPELRHSPVPAPAWLPGPALMSILAGASMLRVSAFREVGGFSPRLWIGGEEELLSIDLAARGWWMCWAEDVLVHHAASAARDPRARRRLGIRNTLWTAWLRRPLPAALRRTVAVLRAVPRDRASVAAVAAAAAGLPWVIRERRPVPAHVEDGLRLLEKPQRDSPARRYVG